ncbi:aminodeoxychorismate synthase component I [Labrys sp. KNU-23]|uniref:aminodeoxychorismate synthase component I n=1 Tax=Labrys sp. KNU-23 TaxID=2789216 RepID=UPI0011F024A1|nr:aminodeoxychorismate synthase component I [Labrys sp. KNU-23]QEN90583.1 aminodeoxychorismate synthase component I [Labrys sp. KNU-23]
MIIIEIPWIDPVNAAAAMASQPRLALLDSAMPHETLGRWSYLAASPFGRFKVVDGVAHWNDAVVDGAPMEALRHLLRQHARPAVPGAPPFTGGAIGNFAYEAGHLFERLGSSVPSAAPGSSQIDLPFYDRLLAFDTIEKRAFAIAPDQAGAERLVEGLEAQPRQAPAPSALIWRDSRSRSEYEAEVARVVGYIRDGDIFQANLSHRFSATPQHGADPLATYLALRRSNPAPFAALLVDGERFIASTSPERFLRLDAGPNAGQENGAQVEARPIKGTKRRCAHPAMDLAIAQSLARSEKDRAENIMIVDLLRNDLSRVCEAGSVEVPLLCGIETYASVHHLTSAVTGRLKAGLDATDLIAATFPGGSITGAPKIRAMEIIGELEREPRGAYCGAIGWIGFDGAADLNIAIRTLTYDGQELVVRAGGGITLLSDPFAEYDETLAKAERLIAAFEDPARAEEAA